MLSIHILISCSPNLFPWTLKTVPQFISPLLSCSTAFSPLRQVTNICQSIFTLWSAETAKYTKWLAYIFSKRCTKFGLQVGIGWSVCISMSHRILWVLFSCLCIYHLGTVKLLKTFLFQAIQFSQTDKIQTIQFSMNIVFVYRQLNVKTVPFQTIQLSLSTV